MFGDLGGSGASGRSLLVYLVYPEDRSPRPVPLACELDLLALGSDEVVASARVVRLDAEPGGHSGRGLGLGVTFELQTDQTDVQQRFLLELAAGELSEVRLAFQPSRAVALREPPLTRYWADEFEVTVPVVEKGR